MKKTERTQKWISKSYKISKGAYLSSWWEKNSRRRWNKWKALVQCSRTKKRMKLNKLLNRCFKMATSSNSPKEAAFITKFQRRMKTIMIQRWISHRRRNLKGWRGILKKSRRSASQKKVGRSLFSRILWWILQKRIYRKDTRLVLRGVDSSSNMVMGGGLWSIILRLRRTKRCRFGIFCRSSKSKNWAEFRCPCWLMNRQVCFRRLVKWWRTFPSLKLQLILSQRTLSNVLFMPPSLRWCNSICRRRVRESLLIPSWVRRSS